MANEESENNIKKRDKWWLKIDKRPMIKSLELNSITTFFIIYPVNLEDLGLIELKEKAEKEGKPALRNFAKTAGNGTYGQMLKKEHEDIIQFVNNADSRNEFFENNKLEEIIFNDDDANDGYHVFIGKRISDETKDLTSRSRFLGSFVLSYSRLMLDNIINAIYGKDRFNESLIKNQVYLGDTDSLIAHSSHLDKLMKSGYIGDENGKLTDDLNKSLH